MIVISFQGARSHKKLAAISLPVPNKIVCAVSHRTLEMLNPGTANQGVRRFSGVSSKYCWWDRKVRLHGASTEKFE